MSESSMFWFHCGRCGSLFQSQAGESENRFCSKCGFNPCTELVDDSARPVPLVPVESSESTGASSSSRRKRNHKKPRNQHFMLKLIGGWTLVLALIIIGAKHQWGGANQNRHSKVESNSEAPVVSDEDVDLLTEAVPKIGEVFGGFLAATSPEERNQFVFEPVVTAQRMARFYGMNSIASMDPNTVSLKNQIVLRLPGEKAVETLWTTADGKTLDALFRKTEEGWRLDWEHFSRYSDYPWALFLAGTGDPWGDFRLLARERTVEERSDRDTTLSLVLYAPKFGQPHETGFQSPEFIVRRDSLEGRLLEAAFVQVRSGKRPFESSLANPDPEGMIRINVRVTRTDTETGRKFAIGKVHACHWYSIEDPGVLPAESGQKPEDH